MHFFLDMAVSRSHPLVHGAFSDSSRTGKADGVLSTGVTGHNYQKRYSKPWRAVQKFP